ncbi:MAG TPA: tRNA adenosine(34) deaminase TadA [Candidatus Anaerobutyricum stercoripullorum]|uniref:tRNA-specific adenosine deaminase n=1 Tax=Candidatus Anaerobutyricum stercoripullorum TaxID=2838456 RepID=A0A9D2BEE4_9FIRM|nr:tRNA adenosine(34) deaminase TadA [Candidatus Anaerobutyricum stercoripullorum]
MRKYTEDERFMKEAIRQARKAEAIGDVPIGCVIVSDGKIIARGYNKRNKNKTVLAHAELLAMSKACKKAGDWRLEECTMYITLEPCQMCAGAIVQARIPRVVIGSMNPKAGCGGSILNLLQMEEFNHQVDVTRGVLEEECSRMLSDFFRNLRRKQKEAKRQETEEKR